jgi:hypothetical protein
VWPAEKGVYLVVGARRIDVGRVIAGRWLPMSLASVDIVDGLASSLDSLVLPDSKPGGGADLHVVVSDRWLNVAEVPWSAALADGARADAVARQRLVEAGFGADAAATVRLDDAGFEQPRLAVAYPAELLGALSALAQRSGLRLRSVLPLSVAGWHAHARPKGEAMLTVDDGAVIVATGTRHRVGQVVVRTDTGSWQTQWARAQLRNPRLKSAQQPAVLDLSVRDGVPLPPALGLARAARKLRSPVDAVAQAPHSTVGWLAAACVALVALTLSLQAWQAQGQRLAAGADWKRLQQQPAAAVQAAPWTRQELAHVQSANAAIRELNLPIAALLAALQPPRDLRIAVLAVEASGSATVRIKAETRTAAEMAKYAAFVASRNPFTEAYVTHHEVDTASPEKPYRFALEASWRE